ncbi:MAG TPA: ACP S-malonyltransferase [Verrucomicrobiae bacterium]|nr:ACP S-malonyltransferase [Verrucomicrobiae bacterium]
MALICVFPGQGSQKVGMGAGLFERFPELTRAVNEILGYSIEELCLKDPQNELGKTEFTQPALFVVNALTYFARSEDGKPPPDFLAGHSLGEYNALLAGETFDFVTGLRLVQKRGRLMAQARGGAMAAVIAMKPERIGEVLASAGRDRVDIANYNSPSQTVISGPEEELRLALPVLKEAGAKAIPLNVSGAFHSRMMQGAQKEFAAFIESFRFAAPKIPVIANATAAPYEVSQIKETLARQIASPVRWVESIQFLLGNSEAIFEEVGPGNVLTKLIQQIRASSEPAAIPTS